MRTGVTVAVGLVAMLAVVWAIDTGTHSDVVDRNISVGGVPVAGRTRAEVAAVVADLGRRYAVSTLTIDAPGGGMSAGAAEIGLRVDEARTVDAVMAEGRRGFVAARFVQWLTSFPFPRSVPVALIVDERAVFSVVAERDPHRTSPEEPSITSKDGRVVAVAGAPGRGIDPAEVVSWIVGRGPALPLQLDLERRSINPRFSAADANGLVAEASEITRDGLKVRAGSTEATVPPVVLRGWLGSEVVSDELRVRVVPDTVVADLAKLLPGAGRPPANAGFVVSGGVVSITAPTDGTTCCDPEAADRIQQALRQGRDDGPIDLPLAPLKANRDQSKARSLGIVEPVATFTTNHAAGEPRVRNIHRMADMVRGSVIEPNETFSLNGTVGERTTAKGFVEAPVIDEKTEFSTDVGGGVSQFSTTLFNAAFFGGLDITTYGMHGLYIARYPYGREATLDFPSLDLKIRNSTPYGVLIWPTYTETSITVTLYSTKTVIGEQTGQTTEPRPSADPAMPCTRVVTERTRTYPDGRKTTDRFNALYSPKEGIKCLR